MTEFQTYVLIAAALVSGVSLLMFVVGWRRRNARRLEQSRLSAASRAATPPRYTPATSSSFEDRLAASRPVSPARPVAPKPVVLTKDLPVGGQASPVVRKPSAPAPSTYRSPPRKRSGKRGRRGRSSSSSGGYIGGADCSSGSSGGSSCGGGGSSCGGGGGGD
jgi:hypothetical protein